MNAQFMHCYQCLPLFIKIFIIEFFIFCCNFKGFVYCSKVYSYICNPLSIKYSEPSDRYVSRTTLNILSETDYELICTNDYNNYYFTEKKVENLEKFKIESFVCKIFGYRRVFNELFLDMHEEPLSMFKSRIRFLVIEYHHPKLARHLDIVLDKRYLNSGSQILSPLFVSRYLAYEYGTHTIFEDMNYTLSIIDNHLNVCSIDKDQIIKLGIDDYEISDRRCRKDTITMRKNNINRD
jgi:hypothetical protein